jgi:putative ABC transport system permease protein
VTLGVLAAAGVILVRRRGISQAGVDPYLATVPVLAGTAVGLLALRLFPWPVRVLGRLAASGRGAVAFVGLARSGRAPAGSVLPLVALVLAVTIGGFTGSVRVGISAARDVAAARLVGGDLRVSAAEFAPDALDRVTRVPGVTAVASGYLAAPGSVRLSDVMPVDLTMAVLVLDMAEYQRVLEKTGIELHLPAELATARPDGALPVLASPRMSREPALTVRLDGPARRLQVVGTLDSLPGLSRVDFVVIPREALGAGAARRNLLFVAGPRADPAAVRAAARVVPEVRPEDPVGPGRPVVPGDAAAADPAEVTVLVRAQVRDALERSAFNDGISLAFDIAAVAALLAGVAAVGLALMVDAAARGRVLSLLRTMGLAPGPARWLLLVELLPLTVTALVAGAALGVLLPVVLAPALGLAAFAAGTPVTVGLDGGSVGLLAGLLLLLAASGVLIEAAANRRFGLGQVLRVDIRS